MEQESADYYYYYYTLLQSARAMGDRLASRFVNDRTAAARRAQSRGIVSDARTGAGSRKQTRSIWSEDGSVREWMSW